ncbi:MAG TPA: hypothetical protein DIU48_10660 [Acidobacteria bacterium]|nr:hypothetical protein [Acidobacteriota bacterium]
MKPRRERPRSWGTRDPASGQSDRIEGEQPGTFGAYHARVETPQRSEPATVTMLALSSDESEETNDMIAGLPLTAWLLLGAAIGLGLGVELLFFFAHRRSASGEE